MHLFSIQQQLIVPMAIVAKCKNGKTSIKLVICGHIVTVCRGGEGSNAINWLIYSKIENNKNHPEEENQIVQYKQEKSTRNWQEQDNRQAYKQSETNQPRTANKGS